ncbi:heat shock protein HspQ [Litoribrevibacter albus]|uniref:Heat shock protein HspQ n=1 Tax=Litoribrevibacter albus TaxID=1473156 RepID=A0AA37W8D6_9GAMM|nr:heat shock protein HspQ [Litoribrevibacter albus]GLQ32308.1 DNA-binding protein [Litoribrevibacter albus]
MTDNIAEEYIGNSKMKEAKFYIGQIVHHKRFDYRGVIFGVDSCFSHSEEWYDMVAMSRPPKDKPWYRVLVDNAEHTTYVAEQNLEDSDDLKSIDHPLVNALFEGFDGERYRPRQKVN